jgi:hypothetical protein
VLRHRERGEVFGHLSFSRCVNQIHALSLHFELSIGRSHRHGVVDSILDSWTAVPGDTCHRPPRGPGGGVGFGWA